MLQLSHISKSYTTGNFTQKALDDVSISFRDNEFVSILGPSGSGKTTMLNIIGGLDHYDSGDLIIEGISTKQFKDRDWDAYRNNRIGFVFQSYNLIPHQTVLANVELALTLSGVSRDERRRRAVEALERVGLGDHVNKKPAQMSGGQMQRVAIARALINDPEILLADEPTGALDSKTSVQIMDLLTEIADDRLVVMVTHNPELAEQYSTRIVNLADGTIVSDSNPYLPSAEEIAAAHAKPTIRTRMSFLTAMSLSFNNLMTKKGRTIMTAVAGSIGIIGIAAILALATGVNNYIKTVEEDTLSVYPLQIMSTGFDMTSMFVGMSGNDSNSDSGSSGSETADASANSPSGTSANLASLVLTGEGDDDKLKESRMMTRMFSSIGNNDLAALKAFFDSGESGIDQHVNSIFYEYAVTPQIFDKNTENGVRQINPDTSFSALGISSASSTNSIMSLSMSTDIFSEMPEGDSVIEGQYDIVRGHWPEKENELVLVLSQTGSISDFTSYVLGLRDPAELKTMVQQFADEQDVVTPNTEITATYDDVLGMTFKLVNATSYYQYNEENGVWVDRSGDKEYMKGLVDDGEDLVLAGIVRPKADAKATALSQGIYYKPSLVEHIVSVAANSQIVKDQLADNKKDVFSGRTFEDLENEDKNSFNMDSLFSIDENAFASALGFDDSALGSLDFGSGSDLSGMDLSSLDFSNMDPSQFDLSGMDFSGMQLPEFNMSLIGGDMTPESMVSYLTETFPNMNADTARSAATNLFATLGGQANAFVGSMREVLTGYSDWAAMPSHAGQSPIDYLASEEVRTKVIAASASFDSEALRQQLTTELANALGVDPSDDLVQGAVNRIIEPIEQSIASAVEQYVMEAMTQMMGQISQVLQTQMAAGMASSMGQFSNALLSAMPTDFASTFAAAMGGAMQFNPDAFANAFQFNMDPKEFADLMVSMMRVEEHSFDNNLKKLGYADFAKPFEISIYPKDFDGKESVISILDDYNKRMRAVDEDKVISYTDIVGTLMQSVTTIINMITTMLIAFVAISLIVSSIMIGVITYISVLERKKEIGILRSIGASKGDVSRVFNAETVIEGLIAGLLGVTVTALGCIPANIIVESIFDVPNVAVLPLNAAAILVGISVVLTFVAGLLPAGSASRKDPVEALRSE